MLEKLVNSLGRLALAGSMLLVPSNAHADDLYKGVRGPTPWQLDLRFGHSANEEESRSTALSVLKYWDGDEIGGWGFVALPYALVPKSGLSGFSIGGGLRGRIKNFHFLSYSKFTRSQGKYKSNIGAFFSTFSQDGKYEITGSVDYGINDHTLNAGFVAGGNITERIRLAPGFKVTKNKEGYVVDNRWVLRYTHSKKLHFEVLQDFGLGNSQRYSTTVLARINIGTK
jgi:hypothetical protein